MSQVQDCVDVIHQHTKGFKPQIGLILGSGLGQFCDNMKTESSLDFKDLP
jgi:purine-nucleoside phosphorylase